MSQETLFQSSILRRVSKYSLQLIMSQSRSSTSRIFLLFKHVIFHTFSPFFVMLQVSIITFRMRCFILCFYAVYSMCHHSINDILLLFVQSVEHVLHRFFIVIFVIFSMRYIAQKYLKSCVYNCFFVHRFIRSVTVLNRHIIYQRARISSG